MHRFSQYRITLYQIAALTISSVFFSGTTRAGTPVYLGDSRARLVSMHTINHSPWNELLTKYVDSNGRVNYRGWHSSRTDQAQLDSYLRHLSTASRAADGQTTKADQLAFWINAYNAVTMKGILREYPTKSIRDHTPKLWGYNIWNDLKLYVGGQPISLDSMEHKVLRKMAEPRIHFAIVCASIGCPRLMNEAYVADRVDDQLTINAKDFFSRQQNFRYDANSKRFYLSAIMDWFGEDFGSGQAAVLKRIAVWLPTDSAINAANRNAVSVSYLSYNWNLNSQ